MDHLKALFRKPTNNYEATIPITFLCKLLGLAPLTYVNQNGKYILTATKSGLVHCSIFFVLYFALAFHGLSESANEITNFISQIATWVEVYINVANAFGVVLLAVFYRKSQCEVYDRLSKVDDNFKHLNCTINYRRTKKHCLIQVISITIICIFTTIFNFFISHYELIQITFWISTHIPIFSCGTVIIQFSTLLFMLQQRFEILNSVLNKTYIRQAPKVNGFFRISNKIHHEELDNFKSNPSLETMDKVFEIHDELCEISKIINSIFGFQILVSLMISFVTILSHIYTLTVDTDIEVEKKIFNVFWTLVHCLSVLTIVVSCCKATEQAEDTKIVLHRIRNDNTEMKNATEMYSLQLLHQNVDFNACGFFALDYTLVYSIIGALTTYLVILIQFNMATPPSSGKNNTNSTTDNITDVAITPISTININKTKT